MPHVTRHRLPAVPPVDRDAELSSQPAHPDSPETAEIDICAAVWAAGPTPLSSPDGPATCPPNQPQSESVR